MVREYLVIEHSENNNFISGIQEKKEARDNLSPTYIFRRLCIMSHAVRSPARFFLNRGYRDLISDEKLNSDGKLDNRFEGERD